MERLITALLCSIGWVLSSEACSLHVSQVTGLHGLDTDASLLSSLLLASQEHPLLDYQSGRAINRPSSIAGQSARHHPRAHYAKWDQHPKQSDVGHHCCWRHHRWPKRREACSSRTCSCPGWCRLSYQNGECARSDWFPPMTSPHTRSSPTSPRPLYHSINTQ